jgi:hypothetical protein
MRSTLSFSLSEFPPLIPSPGFYEATLSHAAFRTSHLGNRMLAVLLRLHDLPPAFQCVADYFVLEGASSHGIAVARRRLLQLYLSCGFHPEEDQEIFPSQLIDAHLQVKVDQVDWENQTRLRVLSYRSYGSVDRSLPRPS